MKADRLNRNQKKSLGYCYQTNREDPTTLWKKIDFHSYKYLPRDFSTQSISIYSKILHITSKSRPTKFNRMLLSVCNYPNKVRENTIHNNKQHKSFLPQKTQNGRITISRFTCPKIVFFLLVLFLLNYAERNTGF